MFWTQNTSSAKEHNQASVKTGVFSRVSAGFVDAVKAFGKNIPKTVQKVIGTTADRASKTLKTSAFVGAAFLAASATAEDKNQAESTTPQVIVATHSHNASAKPTDAEPTASQVNRKTPFAIDAEFFASYVASQSVDAQITTEEQFIGPVAIKPDTTKNPSQRKVKGRQAKKNAKKLLETQKSLATAPQMPKSVDNVVLNINTLVQQSLKEEFGVVAKDVNFIKDIQSDGSIQVNTTAVEEVAKEVVDTEIAKLDTQADIAKDIEPKETIDVATQAEIADYMKPLEKYKGHTEAYKNAQEAVEKSVALFHTNKSTLSDKDQVLAKKAIGFTAKKAFQSVLAADYKAQAEDFLTIQKTYAQLMQKQRKDSALAYNPNHKKEVKALIKDLDSSIKNLDGLRKLLGLKPGAKSLQKVVYKSLLDPNKPKEQKTYTRYIINPTKIDGLWTASATKSIDGFKRAGKALSPSYLEGQLGVMIAYLLPEDTTNTDSIDTKEMIAKDVATPKTQETTNSAPQLAKLDTKEQEEIGGLEENIQDKVEKEEQQEVVIEEVESVDTTVFAKRINDDYPTTSALSRDASTLSLGEVESKFGDILKTFGPEQLQTFRTQYNTIAKHPHALQAFSQSCVELDSSLFNREVVMTNKTKARVLKVHMQFYASQAENIQTVTTLANKKQTNAEAITFTTSLDTLQKAEASRLASLQQVADYYADVQEKFSPNKTLDQLRDALPDTKPVGKRDWNKFGTIERDADFHASLRLLTQRGQRGIIYTATKEQIDFINNLETDYTTNNPDDKKFVVSSEPTSNTAKVTTADVQNTINKFASVLTDKTTKILDTYQSKGIRLKEAFRYASGVLSFLPKREWDGFLNEVSKDLTLYSGHQHKSKKQFLSSKMTPLMREYLDALYTVTPDKRELTLDGATAKLKEIGLLKDFSLQVANNVQPSKLKKSNKNLRTTPPVKVKMDGFDYADKHFTDAFLADFYDLPQDLQEYCLEYIYSMHKNHSTSPMKFGRRTLLNDYQKPLMKIVNLYKKLQTTEKITEKDLPTWIDAWVNHVEIRRNGNNLLRIDEIQDYRLQMEEGGYDDMFDVVAIKQLFLKKSMTRLLEKYTSASQARKVLEKVFKSGYLGDRIDQELLTYLFCITNRKLHWSIKTAPEVAKTQSGVEK